MSVVPSIEEPVSPVVTAGLLLAALDPLRRLGLPGPTAQAVLDATGASRTRAYELSAAVRQTLPGLLRPPGRPPAPPALQAAVPGSEAITRAVADFLIEHPGSVTGHATRRRYSDDFRRLVLEQVEQHPEIPTEALAEAVRVPAATLKDWLAVPSLPSVPSVSSMPSSEARAESGPEASPPEVPPDPTSARIETTLEAWHVWRGPFSPFGRHLREHYRIPYGDTLIARILHVHGVRRGQRRPGRSPDEKALRGQFETFFPGAQWVGDGTPLVLTLNGQPFTFNLELLVDACTGAFTGASVRNTEDAQALTDALRDGSHTTGAPPLAVSLDNRLSNHTREVEAALGETMKIRATPGRPQNDAPVEGAFGLFQQSAPPLAVSGTTSEELARSVLQLVVKVWGRTLNHRPRADRGGRSRVKLYHDEKPSPEQIAAAKAALEERRRRQEEAYRTRRARLDPTVRALLAEAFERLGFEDPDGNLKDAIARYPHDQVLAAIATFEGKKSAGTLPKDAGPRYLLGIVHRQTQQDEGWAIAEALWRARLEAKDRALLDLDRRRAAISGAAPARVATLVDLALANDRRLDRFFWLRATADAIHAEPATEHHSLFRLAARRIHATHRVASPDRQAAVRFLAAQVLVLN